MDASFTNKEQMLADAASLIAKHQAMLDLTFFNRAATLYEALHHCETGMGVALRSEHDFMTSTNAATDKLTIEQWQTSYADAIPEAIAYHKRVCGTNGYNRTKLGCEGPCSITVKSYGEDGKSGLTEGEVKILIGALKANLHGKESIPYSAQALVDLLV